jgi:hypothetical protein
MMNGHGKSELRRHYIGYGNAGVASCKRGSSSSIFYHQCPILMFEQASYHR